MFISKVTGCCPEYYFSLGKGIAIDELIFLLFYIADNLFLKNCYYTCSLSTLRNTPSSKDKIIRFDRGTLIDLVTV